MEVALIFGMGKRDGDQAGLLHQLAAGLQVVAHGPQHVAVAQGQQQMIGAAVDAGRRQTRIQIAGRVTEQRQRPGHQRVRRRFAARGRRLQRRSDLAAGLVPALDRDPGLVERQREHAVALVQRQRGAERDGRVAAERNFVGRREIANPPAARNRRRERGFGESDLGGDALHRRGVGQFGSNKNAGGIAAGGTIGKRGDAAQAHDRSPWGNAPIMAMATGAHSPGDRNSVALWRSDWRNPPAPAGRIRRARLDRYRPDLARRVLADGAAVGAGHQETPAGLGPLFVDAAAAVVGQGHAVAVGAVRHRAQSADRGGDELCRHGFVAGHQHYGQAAAQAGAGVAVHRRFGRRPGIEQSRRGAGQGPHRR